MTGNRDTCRDCGARIIWAVTINGRKIPVDFLPIQEHGHGTVILIDRTGRPPYASTVPRGDGTHTDHQKTCVYRDISRPSASREAVERRAS